jgi:hypothetical protein
MTDSASYDQAPFRITVWPPKIELPPIGLRNYELDPANGALIFDLPHTLKRSHGEIYLALYALDLDSADAILAFANQYGHLGGLDMLDSLEQQQRVLRTYPDEAISESQRAAALPAAGDRDLEVLEEFRFAARLLRDLTSAWRVVSGQASPDAITWHYTQESSHREARALLRHLSPLLRGLHPTLDLMDRLDDAASDAPTTAQAPSTRWANLYEICAAELFNHIANETDYKTCANETCQKLFVRQRGRAIHGQHRTTGVMYCSSNCARAQNQRAYRRRLHSKAGPP